MSKKILKNIGICLLGVSCLSLGVAFSQSIKNGLNNIIDKVDDIITPSTPGIDDVSNSEDTVLVDGEEVKTGSVVDMPKKLTFRKASANTEGITISATVLPENATEKKLTWSVSWLDSSLIENKVEDYIEICPSEDTLSCTIKCLFAFCDDVVLSVSSGSVSKNISIGFIPSYPICDGQYDFSVASYESDDPWIDEYFFSTIGNQLIFDSPNDSLFNFRIWNYKNNNTQEYYNSLYSYGDSHCFKLGEEAFCDSTYDEKVSVHFNFTDDFIQQLNLDWSKQYSSDLFSFLKNSSIDYENGINIFNLNLQDSNILRVLLNSSISSNQIDCIINSMDNWIAHHYNVFEIKVDISYVDREGNVVYTYNYCTEFNPVLHYNYVAVSDICVSTDDIILND